MAVHILVVEDEAQIRATLQEALEFEGYVVRLAANGHEALQQLQGGCPDLILMDLMMPGVSGWDVLERRAQQQVCPTVPVVLISASPHLIGTAMVHNVQGVVPKPFELDTLLETIQRALRS
jgi:CheY-like chemotaxis protein